MKELPHEALVPWARSVEEVFERLGSSSGGLTEVEATRRAKRYGSNEFARGSRAYVPAILARQFMSPLIFVLLGAAALTTILREPIETGAILLAVFVNTSLGFYQEYRAEHTLEKLTSYIRERCRVIRDGREREIDSAALVPGDIVTLSLGARVAADARVIASNGLTTDESFLTGESLPVRKETAVVSEGSAVSDRPSMVHAGSLVVEGYGIAVVTATGVLTEIGRIAELVFRSRSEPTPLQKALRSLAWLIFGGVSLIVSGLFVLGLSRGIPLLEMLLLSAATAVGAVPEALPIALTVILAIGVEQIAARKGIMRSLSAAETLGSTTVVMTDKTGTLTQAKMTVTAILSVAKVLAGERESALKSLSDPQRMMLQSALLATEALLENPDAPQREWRFTGRPMETNIARAALDAGIDIVELSKRRRAPVLPFNSSDKFSLTYDARSKEYVALGAPEILLERSELSKDDFLTLEAFIKDTSAEGKRILGVARLRSKEERIAWKPEEVRGLEFMGVIVLYDPVREDASDAVRQIEAHGASVVMLTGDLKGTAVAIARELGWEVGEGGVMTGAELRQFSDDELSERLTPIRIFARVTPEDKLRIGRLYQRRGEVVAMTGDGVNDAPSLKAVDIGIALGSGTDVAKSAADLILLNDNFKTIVAAIEEGRRIISNIRKAFVYLLSNGLDEVFLIGGSLVFALPLPLTAMQIIWVNFFTGSLPALSFAFEENRDVGKNKELGTIFSPSVRLLTLGIGILTSFLLFALYAALLSSGTPVDTARTVLFICFAGHILVIAISFKSLRRPIFTYPLFDNRPLNISLVAAGLILVASLALPFFRELLDLTLISFGWSFLIAAVMLLNIGLVEAAKWGYRLMH